MSSPHVLWLLLRLLRWVMWLGFFAYSAHFMLNPQSHLTPFGQLFHSTELVLFGSASAAVFLGFLELMMRERAGLERPAFGQLSPRPVAPPPAAPSKS